VLASIDLGERRALGRTSILVLANPAPHLIRAARGLLPVALLLASLPACEPRPARRPNVVILAVDTLRQDHLSFNGYSRPTSPFLDAASRDARVFPNAYSPSPWTLPSFVSTFTSRYPSRHGVMWVSARLADEESTLAEILGEHGYATQGFFNNPLLDPRRNIAQGFDGFEEYGLLRNTADHWVERNPAGAVRSWLDARDGRPFFLFVHFMEPHASYIPAPALADLFDPGYDGPARSDFPPSDLADAWRTPSPPGELPPADLVHHGVALYDTEILEVDRSAGTILRLLGERDLLEDTIVVFLSDHGEEHWDHGAFGHDHSVYEELIRVPLFVRFPERVAAGVDAAPARLIDVAPTILDAAGIAIPDAFEGTSLLGRGGGERPVFAEALLSGGERKAYLEDGWKLQLDVFLGRRFLYDLRADPAETRDLAEVRPDKADELHARLAAQARLPRGSWHLALAGTGDPGRPLPLDAVLTTDGRFVQCTGYELENRRGDEERLDKWKISDDGKSLALQMTSRLDVDGVTFFVDPPDSRVRFELRSDGAPLAPDRVLLGAAGVHPEAADFTLDPGAVLSDAGVLPAGWTPSGAAVAIWTVEGRVRLGADTVELDSAAVEQLRALGYVE
jgi:arylsulfatase A-like enzyme